MDLNFIDNSFMLQYHLGMINKVGVNSAKALGWHSREGQTKRFEALAKAGDMTGCSVLDVGCGTADLLPYLCAKYPEISYTGVDLNDLFLNTAAERYHDWPGTTFLQADISTATLPAADYVLASGALSYRHSEEGYVHKMIKKLYDSAHKVLAFNLLGSLSGDAPLLRTYEPEAIVTFCRTLSDDVALVQGYWEGDFMVRMGRGGFF